MEITAPSPISITSSRYRHRAQNVWPYRKQEVGAKEVGLQEKDQQSIMGQGHRIYHHRREAQAATRILTVNVEVVATVDTSGNVVVQETVTQASPTVPTLPAAISTPHAVVPSVAVIPVVSAVVGAGGALVSVAAAPVAPAVSVVVAGVEALVPSVPSVPSMPSGLAPPVVSVNPALPQVPSVPPFPTDALPVVPSVPPFPSDLNVPAYPWPSGVVSAQAVPVSIAPATSSSAYTTRTESSASHVPISTPYPASNSTLSSVRPSVSTSTFTSLSTLNSVSSTISQLASSSESISLSATVASSFSSLDASASSPLGTATSSQGAAGTNYGGAGGPANTAVSPAQTNVAAGAGTTSSSLPLQTPQVVGSVVGSLAGVALILAVLLFLLRRHKQRQRGTLQLTEDDVPGSAQPMTQDISRNNRIPSAFLHRFSGMSRSTAETSTSGGERSFQRISGRKLPSAFSEGMTSEQFSRGGTMSESSFYQDDHGTYGGQGLSKEMEKEIEVSPTATGASAMTFRPGPARTPIIRHPEDVNPFADPTPFPGSTSHLSPPQSPNPDIRRGTLGRSLASADGSRSSKFTENV